MALDDGWYEPYLGNERFARFLSAAHNDRSRAVALVDWDREMRGELQKILGEWEIALRNAYDAVMSRWWIGPEHWLLDPMSPVRRPIMHGAEDVNKRSREAIVRAVRRMRPDEPIGQLISHLNLDFWRYLSVKAREKSLWVPALHRAFPRGTERFDVDRQIDMLYRLRNRVAHHEPIFHKPIKTYVTSLVFSCERIRPELGSDIAARDSIARLWRDRPIDLR
ncbi:Abi family protein [Hamadaea tsunoensis]|uniref:Abi family protein n=1 Tax=Hamadaea tsunoensis TaxID=53368 RepID=UPI00054E8C0A|nr:Abi family protein [Hamadaea tsunoensis]